MDRAEALIEAFASDAMRRGGNCYFCRRTALEIVDRCEAMQLHILGIDGYFLTDRITQQPIDWILDMSENPCGYDAARQFIRSGAALPLFYEFVLSDPT
jgi:hypothetical protein